MKTLDTNNPAPTKGKHLMHLVEEFALRFPKLQTQRGAYNKCKFASYELVIFLRQRGFKARLVHIQNCPAPAYPLAHIKWQAKRRDKWSHYVVGIGHWCIDLTAKQFDSDLPVPHIQSFNQIRKTWVLVEDDNFLNAWTNDVLQTRRKS